MADLSDTAGCGHLQPAPTVEITDTEEIIHIGEDVLKAAKEKTERYRRYRSVRIIEEIIHIGFKGVVRAEKEKLEAHVRKIEFKIHRFPANLRGFGRDKDYIAPRIVAIGPYYHRVPELQAMEEVKRMAAYYFCEGLADSPGEVFKKIRPVARNVRGCYADADALYGITDDDFVLMMFFDGCFLVQCMDLFFSEEQSLLENVLRSKGIGTILRDMMLLENQIPWPVLDALTDLRPVPVARFIGGVISNFRVSWRLGQQDVNIDKHFEPPHLLGLIHFYQARPSSVNKESRVYLERGNFFRFLRKLNCKISMKLFCSKRGLSRISVPEESGPELRSRPIIPVFSSKKKKGLEELTVTTSAADLVEIGVKLTSCGTTQFSDMKVERGPLFATLSLAPLLLTDRTACWLVNMAAFEQCTRISWEDDYPVNSYLCIVAQLMNRDDDVRELCGKRMVHTTFDYKQTLKFFKHLFPCLAIDNSYFDIFEGLEEYKQKRWVWIAIYKFIYKNAKTIATLLSIVGVLVGIFKTLIFLKHQQP